MGKIVRENSRLFGGKSGFCSRTPKIGPFLAKISNRFSLAVGWDKNPIVLPFDTPQVTFGLAKKKFAILRFFAKKSQKTAILAFVYKSKYLALGKSPPLVWRCQKAALVSNCNGKKQKRWSKVTFPSNLTLKKTYFSSYLVMKWKIAQIEKISPHLLLQLLFQQKHRFQMIQRHLQLLIYQRRVRLQPSLQ